MENKGLSAEQLNMIPHDVMVQMYLQQTEAYRTLLAQNNQLLAQNEELIRKVGSLEEKLAVMNQRMFGRKTERMSTMSDQLRVDRIKSTVAESVTTKDKQIDLMLVFFFLFITVSPDPM